MAWIYILAAIFIGVIFSLQPVINAAVARTIGTPLSAGVLSVSITLTCLIILSQIQGGGNLRPSNIITLPWWAIFGGLIGVFAVAGLATIAPVTGAAVLFVCMVAGQLIGSAAADHFGAFGLDVRPLSLMRIMGLILVFAGALLVRKG